MTAPQECDVDSIPPMQFRPIGSEVWWLVAAALATIAALTSCTAAQARQAERIAFVLVPTAAVAVVAPPLAGPVAGGLLTGTTAVTIQLVSDNASLSAGDTIGEEAHVKEIERLRSILAGKDLTIQKVESEKASTAFTYTRVVTVLCALLGLYMLWGHSRRFRELVRDWLANAKGAVRAKLGKA